MTCIYFCEINTAGFGTGYRCDLTGEIDPPCDNCEDFEDLDKKSEESCQ